MDLSSILGLPLGLMTGAQFLTLMTEALKERRQDGALTTRVTDVSNGQKYAYGISGICEIFGCSKPTAQRIKKSGIIDGAIIQNGRTIVVDRQKALFLVQEGNAHTKGGRRCRK